MIDDEEQKGLTETFQKVQAAEQDRLELVR
jgi:hypothetical protein